MAGIKVPQTLNEFESIVISFAHASIAELEARWTMGERNFVIELMVDRTRFRAEKPLSWFQRLWYDITEPAIKEKPYARSYADYLSRFGSEDEGYTELHFLDIMVYRLIVSGDDSGSSSSIAEPIAPLAVSVLA